MSKKNSPGPRIVVVKGRGYWRAKLGPHQKVLGRTKTGGETAKGRKYLGDKTKGLTESQANGAYRDFLAAVNKKAAPKPKKQKDKTVTVGDLIAHEIARVQERHASPGDNSSLLRRFRRFESSGRRLENIPLADLTPRDVTAFFDSLTDIKKPGSWNQTRKRINAAFNQAPEEMQALLSFKVSKSVKSRPVANTKKHEELPTDKQCISIVNEVRRQRPGESIADVLELIFRLGSRPKEIYSLAAADYVPAAGEMPAHFLLLNHKQNRINPAVGPRRVLLDARCVEIVQPYYEALKRAGKLDQRLLSNGAFAWSRNSIAKAFRAARDRLKMPETWTPYTFRHASITRRDKAGTNIFVSAQIHGTSVHEIQSRYRHEDLTEALAEMNRQARDLKQGGC